MKLLILDSGHAEYVSGKEAPDKSMREWEFNTDMQYRIKALAEKHGLSVYLTNPNPTKQDEMGLSKRADLANSYWQSKNKPTALFFSIHSNAYKNTFNEARGTETYVASNASQNSKNAAKYIQDSIYNTIKSIDPNAKDRGVKVSDFTVIYKAQIPAILEEYGFYTNKDDLKILKEYRKELAEATIKGICQYFSIQYIPSDSEKPEPPIDLNPPSVEEELYENCIVYSSDADENIAQILSWDLKDCIVVSLDIYKKGLGKNIYVIGNACQSLKGDYSFYGKDRWETLDMVIKYIKGN
ncbi:MAG: N-acetylmuramoyl-L-alanine amidase family protein [Romboutsia sp.]|uniref:N-acetylmuramoyl-L-alanine amidase family protein n=1 Tax=Romboutsia sp. TaxID=1965302 RepID=UPI003F34BB7A